MSLRRKLILLLLSLAVFAVGAAAATIYAIQWQVQGAVQRLNDASARAAEVDRLRFELREQMFYLREVVEGQHARRPVALASRDEFLIHLRQVGRFLAPAEHTAALIGLADRFEVASDDALRELPHAPKLARQRFIELETELVPDLESRLTRARAALHDARSTTVWEMESSASRSVILTVAIAGGAAFLVLLGAMLIRQWLIVPIAELTKATQRFGSGDFAYRVTPRAEDELGRLGRALNELAQRVDAAQQELRDSEAKHRALFQNLRDAVVICDADGRIVEYNDGETRVLGAIGPEPLGHSVFDVWPQWSAALPDIGQLVARVLAGGRCRFSAVPWGSGTAAERFADVLAYRVDFGGRPYATLVIRDVSDRQRLQRRVRRGETMEAVGTLASGLAHDFNNILTSVTGTLNMLSAELTDFDHADRVRSALRACWQAAGLSRRLLNFATSAHGDPQVFRPQDMIAVILESLDPAFRDGLVMTQRLEGARPVRMDRDQFTQVVMNLLRNARDAMPDGGSLSIALESRSAADPDDPQTEREYAVLVVRDTGVGMTPEVRQRVFEPLFTTKSRAARRGRGLGLAIVYSAVKNAGGFTRILSEPGVGTTFEIYLPPGEGPPQDLPAIAAPVTTRGAGRVLLVDDDVVTRTAWQATLVTCGYDVTATIADDITPATPSADVAVVDVRAGGDGLAVAHQLLAERRARRLVLTAEARPPSLSVPLAAAVQDSLIKPVNLQILADTVAAAMAVVRDAPDHVRRVDSSGSRSDSM